MSDSLSELKPQGIEGWTDIEPDRGSGFFGHIAH